MPDFSINTEMSVDLNNFNPETIIGQILLNLQENLSVITLATCVIGKKTLDVLNTNRHIFVNKVRNLISRYLRLDYETGVI